MRKLRVAVDTGGTFTDFVVLDEATGALDVFKVPSTRGHEADGIVGGIARLLERVGGRGERRRVLLARDDGRHERDPRRERRAHGAAWSPRAFAASTRSASRAGRTAARPTTSSSRSRGAGAAAAHRRSDRTRSLFDGSVLTELDEETARTAIRRLVAHGVESAAVCFLFSFRNAAAREARRRAVRRARAAHQRLALVRGRAADPRILPALDDRRERVPQPARGALHRRARIAAARDRQRRRSSTTSCAPTAASRPSTRRAQRSVQTILSGPAAGVVAASRTIAESPGFDERRHLRHGRHEHRRRADPERPAGPPHGRQGARPRRARADARHPHRRGRRRNARVDRQRRACCRSARRAPARSPGPACYGTRRNAADDHRRERRARAT